MNRLGEFLRARRGLVQPESVGMGTYGTRRVAGLRRDELAQLAGVSQAYYTRLEQGRDRFPSESVLRALARALQLDRDATEYLVKLGLATSAGPQGAEEISPMLASLVETSVTSPAFVVGRSLDVLAANHAARAVHPSFEVGRNLLLDVFLDDDAQAGYAELERVRDELTASLRINVSAAASPEIDELVAELTLAAPEFTRRWERQDVRRKAEGTKIFAIAPDQILPLEYETLAVEGADQQLMVIYHAAAGSDASELLERVIRDASVLAH
jgi:transcriptional regulator with XRE-family HTH domain